MILDLHATHFWRTDDAKVCQRHFMILIRHKHKTKPCATVLHKTNQSKFQIKQIPKRPDDVWTKRINPEQVLVLRVLGPVRPPSGSTNR